MFFNNLLPEEVWFHYLYPAAVVEQPIDELRRRHEVYAKQDAPVRKFLRALAGVPVLLDDPMSRFRFEKKKHIDRRPSVAVHDAPRVAQVVVHVEIVRNRVALSQKRGLPDTVDLERSDRFAVLAIRDHMPASNMELYVVGGDGSFAHLSAARPGFIGNPDLASLRQGVI